MLVKSGRDNTIRLLLKYRSTARRKSSRMVFRSPLSSLEKGPEIKQDEHNVISEDITKIMRRKQGIVKRRLRTILVKKNKKTKNEGH